MAEAWQTLEEAALTLGISSRTLHRRLARGEFETRMENGRREVLVVVEEPDPSLARLAAAARYGKNSIASDTAATSASASVTSADTAVNSAAEDDYGISTEAASEEVQQTMLALHEDRLRRTDLAIMAYQQSVMVAAAEARRAVTRSRVAWGVTSLLVVTCFLGATWAAHRVTQATAEVSHLSVNVRELTNDVEVKSREIKELRQDSQAAKVSAARAEGELVAAKRQVDQLLRDRDAERTRLTSQIGTSDTSATAATTRPAATPSTAQPAAAVMPATQPTVISATTQPAKS